MKIGIEAQRLFRKKKHGMEVVTLEIIKHLQKIDKVNQYIVYVKDDTDSGCIGETDNFKIKVLPRYNHPFWEQILLPRYVKKDNVDILHCTSNTAPVLYKRPMVLTLHDIIYLEVFNFSSNAYQNFGNMYRRIIVPKSVANSKHTITVSKYEKQNIVNYFQIKPEFVSVVYNGVSRNFQPNENDEIEELDFLTNFPNGYLLFLGNTAYKKNTVGVLKAYKILLESCKMAVPTLVITDVSERYIFGILSEIKAIHLMNHIYISGHVPYSYMPVFYQKAKIFLYPSLRESFGLPILESMACGTPVVTSKLTAMPEIAGEAAILIDPHNPVEIANGIAQLIKNKENIVAKNVAMGAKNVQNFEWETSARKLLEIYSKTYSKTYSQI